MEFKTEKQLHAALLKLPKSGKGRRHYPVLFKKAFMDFVKASGKSRNAVCSRMGLSTSLVQRWATQYEEGLYTLEGAYSVSKKSLSTNELILKQLHQDMSQVQAKIDLVKEASALGMTVS